MTAAKRLFLIGSPVLILIDLISGILSEYSQVQIEKIMNAPGGESYLIWVYGSFNLILYLILAIVSLTLALYFIRPPQAEGLPLAGFVKQNTSPLAKEFLRSFGKAGLWAFLLILPGVVRFIQFSLVPFIVAFSPGYQAGRLDALRASTQLVNGALAPVLAIEVFVYFGLSFILSMTFSQWTSYAATPVPAFLLTAAQTFVFLLSFWLLYCIFQKGAQNLEGAHDATGINI